MNILKTFFAPGLSGSLAALFLFTGCTEDGVSQQEYDEVLNDLKKARMQADDLESQLEKAKDQPAPAPAVDTSELESKIDELSDENQAKDAEIEKLKKEFREYKATYRLTIREKLIGKKVAELVTTKETFKDVEVREITAVGLRISHSGGTGRVRFEDLEKKLQDQLGYDEEEAAEIIEKEMAERAEKAKLIAETRAAQAPTAEEKEAQNVASLERERDRLNAWIRTARGQYKALRREAYGYEAKERYAKSRGRVSYWGPKAAAANRKAATLDRNIQAAITRVKEINRKID